MKKLVFVAAMLMAPLFFTACSDDAIDDLQPQSEQGQVVAPTDGEEGDDR
ncbi:hypothetical protein QQ020_35170 [Fulvivirgaceae bacterium BMA12]|uniref:Lipoprotein n=1 Tax=Agaribacillus aureus TaxID=3051825 RepID=A0ABT8LHS6_9BACT|nr:hypothetical protein [Fulvivirgaceae bacterium BMA12]